jgi:hypothetical protein
MNLETEDWRSIRRPDERKEGKKKVKKNVRTEARLN